MADKEGEDEPAQGPDKTNSTAISSDDIHELVKDLDAKKGSGMLRKLGYGLGAIGALGLFVGGMYARDTVIEALTSARDTIIEKVTEANNWAYWQLNATPSERAVDFGISLSAYSHKPEKYGPAILDVVQIAADVATPTQLESLTRTTFNKMTPEQQKALAGAIYNEVGLGCKCK